MLLVPISRDDKDYLFNLQNIPGIRDYALNPNYPTLEEHEAWFASKLNSNETLIYKILIDKSVIGVIRVDKFDNLPQKVEISLTIDPQYSGKGYAKQAIKTVIAETDFTQYVAVIHVDNIASIKAFLANGFQKSGGYKENFSTYNFVKE